MKKSRKMYTTKNHRYQDYVIKDGCFIGRFEEMYAECLEIPWHQDETASAVFTDIDISVLRHMNARHGFQSVADVGCGLGYVTSRFQKEAFQGKVDITGFDVSWSAVLKARQLFPEVHFERLDITKPVSLNLQGAFDLVVCKECHWYVLDHIERFRNNLLTMSRNWVYIVQSFPETRPYLGMDIFPRPEALIDFWTQAGYLAFHLVEWDEFYDGRPLVHLFLGKKGQRT